MNPDNKSTKCSLLSITIKTGFVALKDLRRVAKDLGELTDDNMLQEMIERADLDLMVEFQKKNFTT